MPMYCSEETARQDKEEAAETAKLMAKRMKEAKKKTLGTDVGCPCCECLLQSPVEPKSLIVTHE